MIITKMLINSCGNYPNKKGFIDSDRTLLYKELGARAEKVKRSLQKLGVKHGDRVAVLLPNSSSYLEISFGITALGAIIVPLNIKLNSNELSYILNDSGAKILFAGSNLLSIVEKLKKTANHLQEIIVLNYGKDRKLDCNATSLYEDLLNNEPVGALKMENVKEDDIAGLFYTSGTTGKPKGVIHTHKGLFASANNHVIFQRMKHNDTFLHALPFFHIGGFLGMLAHTLIGATHAALHSFDPKSVLQLCHEEKLNSLVLVPTMVNMIINDPNFDQYDTSALNSLAYGGSPMPLDVFKKINMMLPNLEFSQGYGSTETASAIIVLTKEQHDYCLKGNEEEKKRLTSVGQPVGGMEVKVVGPDNQELNAGEVGEIVARGPMIMKGYWNLPEQTSSALRDGWYYTGDIGYKDEENFFYVVDRAKDMIISGGENIYSIEIEHLLYKHPKILECAVIGVPDEKWGEAVKAIVIGKSSEQLTEEEIISFSKKNLANYKVPKSIDFVKELPKNGAGKILKHELRKKYWDEKSRMVN